MSTPEEIASFAATGSAQILSRAIEAYAESRRAVSVLVVPWESNQHTINMAVTSVKADGWAIEHTDIGTVRLTTLGPERTRISIIAHETDHPERERLAKLLGAFAKQIQDRFQADTPAQEPG